MKRQRKQFKATDIVAFWYPHFANKFDDEADMLRCCFRCTFNFGLQKAHIVALADGGADVIENIHILCRPCHQATEGVAVRCGRAFYDRSMQMTATEGYTFHHLRIGLPGYGGDYEAYLEVTERLFMQMGADGFFARFDTHVAKRAQATFEWRVAGGRFIGEDPS